MTLPGRQALKSWTGNTGVCWRIRHLQMNQKLRAMSFTSITLLQDQRGR